MSKTAQSKIDHLSEYERFALAGHSIGFRERKPKGYAGWGMASFFSTCDRFMVRPDHPGGLYRLYVRWGKDWSDARVFKLASENPYDLMITAKRYYINMMIKKEIKGFVDAN